MDLVEMLYGQGGTQILEKTASERFITKLADDMGVDLSKMSETELNMLEPAMLSAMQEAGLIDMGQDYSPPQQEDLVQDTSKLAEEDQIDGYESENEIVDDAVTLRALEMLDENGYNPDAVMEKVKVAAAMQQAKLNAMMEQAQGGELGPVPGFKELIQGGAVSNATVSSGIRESVKK